MWSSSISSDSSFSVSNSLYKWHQSSMCPVLTTTMTSPRAGLVDFSRDTSVSSSIKVEDRESLNAPADNVIMISVRSFQTVCSKGVSIYTQGQNSSQVVLWKGCDDRYASTYILEANNVTIQWRRPTSVCVWYLCNTVRFSFHEKSKVPQILRGGLLNCSVEHYWSFQQYVDCNMKEECEDGRDEAGHCPFSSPACQGWVAVRNKCYRFVTKETLGSSTQTGQNTFMKAMNFCASLNARVGMFRDEKDSRMLYKIFEATIGREIAFKSLWLGLSFGALSVPNVYRRSLVGLDKNVYHHSFQFFDLSTKYEGEPVCFVNELMRNRRGYEMRAVSCSAIDNNFLRSVTMCEFTIPDSGERHKQIIQLRKPLPNLNNANVILSNCLNGQIVHTFLSCYPHLVCGQSLLPLCTFFSDRENSVGSNKRTVQLLTPDHVFTCGDEMTRISYTLVCDFRHHCKDRSDENFCQHPPCDAFACSNGQCVSDSTRCDLVSDCLDDSDELGCADYALVYISFDETRSPVLITFDSIYSFKIEKMTFNETCPETHYRCPGEYNDCLPVYTRCNGWYDCMDHEDEESCTNIACSGFYRCFNSTVCVHTDHLCDGWPHCPQHDDEWLCNMTCPAQCLCLSHVFLCSKRFPAHLFPHLRSLDARGSGMTLSDLDNNFYMLHLSLANCSLKCLPVTALFNLLFLDLSANNIAFVSMTAFSRLANLKTLILAKNSIDLVHYDPNSTVLLYALRTLDLSQNKLSAFDSKMFSNIINVQHLNLSFSSIHTLHPNGFQHTTKLTHLYLAGNPINSFSADVFMALTFLRMLTSPTYILCCRQILPDHFHAISCDAPRDEISSCEDLLRSGTYRTFLWLISVLSLLGNALSFVVRVCVQQRASSSGFHVCVTNLCTADLLMGVYLAIIGVADSLFRGKYLFFDKTWKHSVPCKTAGFLSLLSCEVSALIIWLITLDRFLVLRFPFSRVRFQRNSATVACVITWLVGLFFASVPLLPMTSHWEFFSQTGICIPLPVTRHDFDGKVFSVSVFIVFNFILFVFIATGQAFIYWSVKKNALNTDSSKISQDLVIARRLISVAVTDFLCWFPIGLCGLLALADVSIPGEVNVAFAIFVLPLNSALNPFMYTFNMVMEKRRKSRDAAILQWLESHSDLL